MKFVDAQVHIWSGGVPTTKAHRQIETYSQDELLHEMDEAGVDAAVIHSPTSWDPNSNTLAEEAAQAHPERFAVLGHFALDAKNRDEVLAGWRNRPGQLGLRYTFSQPN